MKTLLKTLKFQISGLATAAPPISPSLGALGVRIMDFCNQYNKGVGIYPGHTVPQSVWVRVYSDKSFEYEVRQPSTANLIKCEIGLTRYGGRGAGSRRAGELMVGSITQFQLRRVALLKMGEMSASNIEAAMRSVEGTCRSMGIELLG